MTPPRHSGATVVLVDGACVVDVVTSVVVVDGGVDVVVVDGAEPLPWPGDGHGEH